MVLGKLAKECSWTFISYTKINSKEIKDLNVKPESTIFLEENKGAKLHDSELGYCFLDMTPKHS